MWIINEVDNDRLVVNAFVYVLDRVIMGLRLMLVITFLLYSIVLLITGDKDRLVVNAISLPFKKDITGDMERLEVVALVEAIFRMISGCSLIPELVARLKVKAFENDGDMDRGDEVTLLNPRILVMTGLTERLEVKALVISKSLSIVVDNLIPAVVVMVVAVELVVTSTVLPYPVPAELTA